MTEQLTRTDADLLDAVAADIEVGGLDLRTPHPVLAAILHRIARTLHVETQRGLPAAWPPEGTLTCYGCPFLDGWYCNHPGNRDLRVHQYNRRKLLNRGTRTPPAWCKRHHR